MQTCAGSYCQLVIIMLLTLSRACLNYATRCRHVFVYHNTGCELCRDGLVRCVGKKGFGGLTEDSTSLKAPQLAELLNLNLKVSSLESSSCSLTR
jgi:hypothetical protein